jgi:nitrite reductase/ring-hydroxylating ferredoxin subunit
MLWQEQNELLTRVGPGTPMGNLLRRYWMPIAGESEFDQRSTKAIRLMGEDLVLYKDLSGTYGLVDRHCPHRRADLSYGFVEDCGIRCNYHGWRFDETGRCIEQPFEDTSLANLRYTGGVGSYIDVLDSESRNFNAEIALAQMQLAERLAEINLYAALGGGWQDAPPAASAGSPIPALSAPRR